MEPVHLAVDYMHPVPRRGRCRVRVFLPDDPRRDRPLVVCSELPDNPGASVTSAAQRIASEVISNFDLPGSIIYVEHWPPEATDGQTETFELVVFAHSEVREVVHEEGQGPRLEVGRPEWKPLDRASVEVLVGRRV
jgi:hypothetical protein